MTDNETKRREKKCERAVSESYRNALQAFIDRRRYSDDVETDSLCSPDKTRRDFLVKTNNNKCDNELKAQESKPIVPGVPHILASEIFEIGWVPGTEDRYLELIFAEWQNTRVSLKRHTHPDCKDAVKADLDVLSEIRHPNVLLLMATTHTDDHGLVSIFESVDCTLYHYIHDQGERISIQGIAKCGGRLSDALRHTHMRGYVHSAISSHCVYLTSSGNVKLGGWELAMQIGRPKPDREHKERLRTEIFRWQAPELFHSCEPRKESDVYGLTLLIWEMCTTHVPWSGYSKIDVDRQYAHWKRGVIMDLYDFPPLLNNLLEAGLQLDVNKRTLDMNRMRRFLQRLEMQYEDEESVYIDQYTNNNNENGKTFILTTTKPLVAAPKTKSSRLAKSASAKQLSFSAINSESPTKQYLCSKKSTPKQNINLKAVTLNEQVNFCAEDVKRVAKDDFKKDTNLYCSVQKNYRKDSRSSCNLEASDGIRNEENFENNSEVALQPWNYEYKKVRAPQEDMESKSTLYSSSILESTDDESFKDARSNLKQLKETLANKREHFFYGNDSSPNFENTSPKTKNIIMTEIKSKDYEPHKPASHKTSLEPKFNKSPGQYDPSCMKSSFQQCRKIPYLHTPESIKGAIIQPQVLNSDPESFFETSLWRKEKLICLSKMRKTYDDELINYSVQDTNDNDTVSTNTFSKIETTDTNSTKSDNTYILNRREQETEASQEGSVSEHRSDSTETVSSPQSKPMQILKDALDRATKIVRPGTPNSDEMRSSPLFEKYEDFEVTPGDSPGSKNIFENMYNLGANDNGEEIKSIERSTKRDKIFLYSKNNIVDKTTNDNKLQNKFENDNINFNNYDNPSHSFETTYSRNFVCESIAEVSSECINSSYNDTNLEKKIEELFSNQGSTAEEEVKPLENIQRFNTTDKQSNTESQVKIKEDENHPQSTNFNLMFLNDSSKVKNCKSCHSCALPRRRSLPAALSQLRLANNSALGKLPIRRGDIPDSTVEDLYIDDEFGDSLNVNMVLLDKDLSFDEDFLSDLSEI
ncbi:uncharacterized protein LOC122400539 isoform X1 [Colletes gigas]|uniref:uncharacterized protein LOC122400539 isoform X1 n=1 Tax=Colletes gigas TaxID=935657 RepID=UPI001C9B537B|nr:uncharacterized protein LOC122400539 isoform X1 [Colletes gigas]